MREIVENPSSLQCMITIRRLLMSSGIDVLISIYFFRTFRDIQKARETLIEGFTPTILGFTAEGSVSVQLQHRLLQSLSATSSLIEV